MKKLHILLLLIFFPVMVLLAQKKIAFSDRDGVLNPTTVEQFKSNLTESGYAYVTMIDFSKKCDYLFAEIIKTDNNIQLEIKDCKDAILGRKSLGSTFLASNDSKKAIIMDFSVVEIINGEHPVKTEPTQVVRYVDPSSQRESAMGTTGNAIFMEDTVQTNHHSSRYFFAPSAYNIKKGELYYNSIYFLIHDVQYGLTDKFSFGMGTTVGGFPFYFTPKLTLLNKDKYSLAVGDMLMVGTYGVNFRGNLLYSTLTMGNEFSNLSLSLGHLHISGDDVDGTTNKPIGNFAFMLQLSKYFYLVSENYMTGYNNQLERYIGDPDPWSDPNYNYNNDPYNDPANYDYYDQSNFIFAGITGIRFINKSKDIVSYQIGLSYFSRTAGAVPSRFRDEYYESNNFFVIPAFSYTHKFGTNY